MRVTLPSGFLEGLRTELSPSTISTEKGDLDTYGRDWTRVYSPCPSVIAFPGSTEEVAKIVKRCAEAQVPIVPSGGRTGLSGGAVAARGELVMSLSRMRQMDPVDRLAQTVRVDAGAVTQAVHEHCAQHGLTWPIDFASKGSSHVGGNIATNAGGVKVIRYGLTRHWVLGLRVVTANGDILDLNGSLEKNQTGPDLRQLFIGSEGTLGIITEAILKLTPLPGDCEVFFFALNGFREVLQLFQAARAEKFTINAFEMLGDNCLKTVVHHRNVASPFSESAPYYVLLEVEKPESENGRKLLEDWLSSLFDGGGVVDGVLAQNPKESRNLWELREGISESLMSQSLVHKHDIALPISRLQLFIEQFLDKLKETYRGFEIYLFGHIGDGNMHVNIRKPDKLSNEEFWAECKSIDKTIFQLVRSHQGSVSAEHGIGLLKKEALQYSRTPSEIAVMRALKQALDPKGIFNPGKILD